MSVMPPTGLRTIGLTANWIGAIGSLAFMFHNGRATPWLLLVGFFFWVLSPFAVLLWADVASRRWSSSTRTALYLVMIVVAAGSLAVYGADTIKHLRPQAAFAYVLVPPVSWIVIAIVLAVVAVSSKTRREEPRDPRSIP
jgi:multisubunit Na+/H+ antiporter MnhG subunit